MAYIGNGPGSIRQGRRAVYEFTSTANQTAFSGTDENGLTLDLLQANDNDVYLNGVRLIITDDYTISGDVLTLTSGAASGDKLIIMTQDEIANDASYSKAASDSRYINYDGDIVNGTIQMGGSGNNITFADNNKAVFGDDSDLQIYHDNTGSYVKEGGTGSLYLQGTDVRVQTASGENILNGTSNGAVTLYHDNSPKIATTSAGIDVTGIVTATGNITAGSSTAGVVTVGSANGFEIQKSGVNGYINQSDNGPIIIRMGSAYSEKIRIDSSGNVGIGTSNPFTKFHAKDTGWSSGAPYGSVSLIEGNNVNDNNWGHLVITDTTTTNGSGGSIRFATGAANALNPFSGIQGTAEGASWGGIGFETRPQSGTATRRMTIDSTGNVGVGTSTQTHKLEVAGTTKAEQYLLDAVAKDISDTAVDVFIYDTRKDSDGGAWRKRTQNTSWYNETLNTATRGSRKEFPAVAVIVAEAQEVTIYDGDDPDMPMWMVFNRSANDYRAYLGRNTPIVTSTTMMNGEFLVGMDNTSWGECLLRVSFLKDSAVMYAISSWSFTGNIAERNIQKDYIAGDPNVPDIVSNATNDVAITVLPNAPIDPATGLSVPTIAVATPGGVSIIKDDGTVVDITMSSSTYSESNDVTLSEEGTVTLAYNNANGSQYGWVYTLNIPSSDTVITVNAQSPAVSWFDTRYEMAFNQDLWISNTGGAAGVKLSAMAAQFPKLALGTSSALTNTVDNLGTEPYLFNYTTSSYNTGWMNGDIKLATLSDTDDTNVTGPSVLTNYNLSSGNLTGWTLTSSDGNGAGYSNQNPIYVATNLVGIGNTGSVRQNVTVETGKKYIVGYKCDTRSGGNYRLGIYFGHVGGSLTFDDSVADGETKLYYWTSDYTGTTLLQFRGRGGGQGDFTNFIFDEVEEDRSVNGNGFQVFGTVPKTPVATGADLVAYGPFTSSNYLQQPYNSDLDFGTSDFMYSMWIYRTSLPTSSYERWFGTVSDSNDERIDIFSNANTDNIAFYSKDNGVVNGDVRITGIGIGVWHCFHFTREANVYKIYHNGELKGTNVGSSTLANYQGANGNRRTHIGASEHWDSGRAVLDGKIALAKISGTIPSPAQIKKIYEDEKVLFQENAKATLYGSSDAVTALAYDDDTELLHVGTSAGRSVFQGLRRIDNTTDAVGAAISASNGMVAED